MYVRLTPYLTENTGVERTNCRKRKQSMSYNLFYPDNPNIRICIQLYILWILDLTIPQPQLHHESSLWLSTDPAWAVITFVSSELQYFLTKVTGSLSQNIKHCHLTQLNLNHHDSDQAVTTAEWMNKCSKCNHMALRIRVNVKEHGLGLSQKLHIWTLTRGCKILHCVLWESPSRCTPLVSTFSSASQLLHLYLSKPFLWRG